MRLLYSVISAARRRFFVSVTAAPGGVSLSVSWDGSSSVETGYRVELSSDGSAWIAAATTAANVTSASVFIPEWNVRKYVRVIAFNSFGDQDAPLSYADVWLMPQFPPSDLTLSSISAYQAVLGFAVPVSTPANGGYLVQAAVTGTNDWNIETSSLTSPVTLPGLTPMTDYKFRILSYNNYGQDQRSLSPASSEVTGSTPQETDPPVVSAAGVIADGNSLTVIFDEPVVAGASGATGFALTSTRAAVTIPYASGLGTNALVFTPSRTLQRTENLTLSFTAPASGIQDSHGNKTVSLSGFPVSNGSTQGAIIEEQFDETNSGGSPGSVTDGYDSPLVTAVVAGSGAINPDSTGPGGAGDFRVSILGTALQKNYVEWTLPQELNDVWIRFRVSGNVGSSREFFYLTNTAGATVMNLRMVASRMNIGSVAVQATLVDASPFGTTGGRIWVHYVRNGAVTLYFSVDGTRPTSGNLVTTGTAANFGVGRIQLGANNNTGNTAYFYELVVSENDPGNF